MKREEKKWSESEERFIKDNYPSHGTKFYMDNLGRSRASIRRKIVSLGISKKRKTPDRYEKNSFSLIVKESFSYSSVCRALGIADRGGNAKTVKKYIEEYNLDISHFNHEGGRPNQEINVDEIFVRNSPTKMKGQDLKKKLIKLGLKEDECEGEGCEVKNGKWLGKEITMQLDHINGDNKDNRIENLRVLCPNCHAATKTFCKGQN